jgi:hypothetical protein
MIVTQNGYSRGVSGPRCWSLLRRGSGLAAFLAGIALLVAACGGGSGSSDAGQSAYQKALAYSQCMRAHGEPGFPDPQANGNILVNGPKDHLNGALMNKANQACQHLLPPHKPLTAAQQRQLTNQALKFVDCMRAHGLPNMADPVVSSTGMSVQIPSGVKPNSPVIQAAQRACRKFAPGAP